MKPRRLVSLLSAVGLVAGGLAAVLPPAHAATPVCSGLVTGLDSANRVIYRGWENAVVEAEKKSVNPLAFPAQNLIFSGGRSLSGGGSIARYTAFKLGSAPQIYDIVNKVSASTLGVKYVQKPVRWFKGRLIATGGRYYLYAVESDGILRQWTRFVDDAGRVWFANPKVVAKYLGGLKTLSYGGTFKIDGVYKDLLYGTSASGKLLQFQIPQERPAYEKVTKLAATGFGDYDWVSPGGCNQSPHYLALVAIDHETNEARLYTLPSQTVPKAYNLANRGLVGDGADWILHAVG